MTDWDRNRAALREHLKHDKLENFLRWSTVEKTMFVGDVGFVRKEYEEIMGYGVIRYYPIIETWVGNPKPFNDWTSGNLIHQFYHLKQWLDRSKKTVDQLSSIVEVGAGYGAMALICRRLGFEGLYLIIDFPELETLQKYYLENTIGTEDTVWFPSASYRFLSTQPYDLLVACHSLSEMPVTERERLMSQVEADAYLFASSYEFEGVDNAGWLQEFAGGKLDYDWAQWAHPHQENALYQVGVKL